MLTWPEPETGAGILGQVKGPHHGPPLGLHVSGLDEHSCRGGAPDHEAK